MSLHRNRVQMGLSAGAGNPGTGTLTLGTATAGYQSFGTAYSSANATVDILITENTNWEVARNCLYTHSGTTVDRGTFEASSSGSAVSFTSAAIVSVIATAGFGNDVEDVCINGGFVYVTADGTNTQTLTAGSFTRLRGNADSPSNGVLRTEVTDERGWWNAGIARFQPTIAGKYLCVLSVQLEVVWTSGTGTIDMVPAWYKNGAVLSWGARVQAGGQSATTYTIGGTATIIATMNGTTDYLEPYAFGNGGATGLAVTARNIAHGNWVTCRFLGR